MKECLDRNDYCDDLVDVVQTDLIPRTSKDNHTNNMGHELISFCKSMQLFICNGRVGSDMNVGDLTCKNASIVDYVLISYDIFDYVNSFHILDFNELYSDVHCPIKMVFKISSNLKQDCHTLINTNIEFKSTSVKWDSCNSEQFVDCIVDDKINSLQSNLKNLLSNIDKTDINDIDKIVNETSNLLTDSASKVNMIKNKRISSHKTSKKSNKPWFDADCRKKRK